MEENKELQTVTTASLINRLVIGGQDLSTLSLDERLNLWRRQSEAQASPVVEDKFLNTPITATHIAPYQRPFVDQETGETGLATYVAFTLSDGTQIKTSSTQALPFAMEMAKFVGVNFETGELVLPITFKIVPQKAPQVGFIYRFVFIDVVRSK